MRWIDRFGLDPNTVTFGEIREYAITSISDFTAPAGLADARESIGIACERNSCEDVDGATHATEPGDQAAWQNILNANGGANQTGGGNFMCVGDEESCWFVHSCYTCNNGSRALVPRQTPLQQSGTLNVNGLNIYFYSDTLRGWDNRANYNSACRRRNP